MEHLASSAGAFVRGHFPPLELWGGVECTVNRVGDVYFSQLDRNGHSGRVEHLRLIAGLGIKAARQPILWERVVRHGTPDWSWTDACLRLLGELGVRPIAGLLHHGSGPRDTGLLDPGFPEKFAVFAASVAERYPALDWYTPVNEPLTTARFSAFYGIWHPHGRSERQFGAALVNQCRATVLAMEAIRRVNPHAQLLQTDDLGKCYSAPGLAYQAGFNNELRWLAWDLLCGTVDRTHALWEWFTKRCDVPERELMWFVENRCPPAMLGVNYYVTSERFLDANLDAYPPAVHGGNGRDRYVDVEASRFLPQPTGGVGPLLDEAWSRYGIPIAITECHIDSTRDEQMRWLAEIWQAASRARGRGIDLRAVTVWALMGSYDWNCLLAQDRGYYEQGAFDTRGARPRPTAIARMMQDIARTGAPRPHPVLSSLGWWRRTDRIPGRALEPSSHSGVMAASGPTPRGDESPILIAGGSGRLGEAFARICRARSLNFRLLSRREMDIADAEAVGSAIESHRPWAIINAAGYASIDDAESEEALCFRENTIGPLTLAAACARTGVPLVSFSTDLVFDGEKRVPYREGDRVAPLNVYGRSKVEAECGVLQRHRGALIVRTSTLFGPWDSRNYVSTILQALYSHQAVPAAEDMTITPTYLPNLVNATLDLLIDGATGIWHLTNGEPITWAEFASRTAHRAGMDASLVRPCRVESLGLAARRPAYSALASEQPGLLPSLDAALDHYFIHRSRMAPPATRTGR